ncbi:MAG: sulfate/molybdate ABC transporter ATP-binding protein, partial [Janthinobacterium lividum]
GGQRQRVALARALATEPELLLLDEPFGALDPLVRKEIRGWLRGLHDRLGLTSILVTHDQEEALEVADRIAVLRDGRLEQVGTPHELEDAPATPFVHQFLGETVTFPATWDQGRLRLDGAWAPIAMTLPDDGTGSTGGVLLSLRPYEIGVSACAAGEIGAHIVAIQRAGAFTRYRLAPTANDQSDALEILVPATLPSLLPGARCHLDLSRARLFGATAQHAPAPDMLAAVRA